jgi:hypothetical protein
MGLRILAIILRALFIGALVAITLRVSSPQSETIWSVYETPSDLIRLALGFAVYLWIVIHLFMLPRTGAASRVSNREALGIGGHGWLGGRGCSVKKKALDKAGAIHCIPEWLPACVPLLLLS